MLNLSTLQASDATDVLQFELENRRYFAAHVTDRGDAYFASFPTILADHLAEQERGEARFFLVRHAAGNLVGRINLWEIHDQDNVRTASLGYRIGERFSGKGYATLAVSMVCETAQSDLRIRVLTAMATVQNIGSQRVLQKSGFVITDGRPTHIRVNGTPEEAVHYTRVLRAE